MNPFGSRDDDPLLQDDPFAPSGDPDEGPSGEEEAPSEEDQATASESSPPEDGGAEEPDSVFAATSSPTSNGSTATADASASTSESASPTRTDVLSYLLENRAALDVLFEMMAFGRADGDEEKYRHFLDAMRERHKVAIQQYREALEDTFPDVELGTESPLALDDELPVSQ